MTVGPVLGTGGHGFGGTNGFGTDGGGLPSGLAQAQVLRAWAWAEEAVLAWALAAESNYISTF